MWKLIYENLCLRKVSVGSMILDSSDFCPITLLPAGFVIEKQKECSDAKFHEKNVLLQKTSYYYRKCLIQVLQGYQLIRTCIKNRKM